MRLLFKIPLYTFIALLSLVILLVLFVSFSPYPSAWLLRYAFAQSTMTSHEDIEAMKERVTMTKDIKYADVGKKSYLDIYIPNGTTTALPTIIWVHGGAFVAGDKNDGDDYWYALADQGFIIVNINYDLAPNQKYPFQIQQIGLAYQFIAENADTYYIDVNNLVFGGDSAGAHMAAQFVAIQTNPTYANSLGIDAIVPPTDIRAVILYCGPYDFEKLGDLANIPTDAPFVNKLLSFIIKRVGWGYTGIYNWPASEKVAQLSIIDAVDGNFPPTFLTDGKVGSFEEHSILLGQTLTALNVEVTEIYYDAPLAHEYQFNLNTFDETTNRNYGLETFHHVIAFLNQYT